METFHVIFNIQKAGSGYEGAFGAGSSAPLGLAGAKIEEGRIKKEVSGHESRTFASFEPSATEAPGLHDQVFTCLLTKVEAETAKEAIEFAGEAYGKKGSLGAVPSAAKTLEFKKG